MKSLSPEFIKNLLRKDDEKLAKGPSIFTEEEHKIIRGAVKDSNVNTITMRGRVFRIRHHRFKDEDWVNIGPTDGYVPMVNAPVKWVLDPEKEI